MAEKDQVGAALARAQAYHDVFNGPAGQAVLEDLKKTHNFYGSCFDTDAIEMARKCGEDNVVKRILSILSVDLVASKQVIEERTREQLDDKDSIT